MKRSNFSELIRHANGRRVAAEEARDAALARAEKAEAQLALDAPLAKAVRWHVSVTADTCGCAVCDLCGGAAREQAKK